MNLPQLTKRVKDHAKNISKGPKNEVSTVLNLFQASFANGINRLAATVHFLCSKPDLEIPKHGIVHILNHGRALIERVFGPGPFFKFEKSQCTQFGRCREPLYRGIYAKKEKSSKQRGARHGQSGDVKALQELYDHGRCTPELRDKLQRRDLEGAGAWALATGCDSPSVAITSPRSGWLPQFCAAIVLARFGLPRSSGPCIVSRTNPLGRPELYPNSSFLCLYN